MIKRIKIEADVMSGSRHKVISWKGVRIHLCGL